MRRAIALLTRVAFLGSLFASGCIDAVVGEVDVCTYNGKGYAAGDKFNATDGCNSCSCAATGEVSCTEIACAPQDAGSSSGGTCKGPDGTTYKIGETFKNDCNTCSCTAQGAACTLIGCSSGDASVGGTCTVGGKTYSVGDSWSDGCNGCSCMVGGQVACTTRACDDSGCSFGASSFAIGTSVVCPDGCNQCACMKDPSAGQGAWTSTLIGCPALPKIEKCANDNSYLDKARVVYRVDNTLAVEATFAGCANEGQKFKLCYDGAFRESLPVQTSLYIVTDTTASCSTLATGTRVFDLSPLADAYKAAYPTQSGVLSVQLEKGDSFQYTF